MTQAIADVFKQHNYKAGNYTVKYQSCDDSTAQAGKWDSATCSANASAYARRQRHRRHRHLQLRLRRDRDPDAQQGAAGGHGQPGQHVRRPDARGPGTAPGEPEKYYPTGKRNYIRVVAADDFQGAADAHWPRTRRQARVHPERQGGVRAGRGQQLPARREEARASRSSASRPGTRRARTTSRSCSRSRRRILTPMFLGGLICENGGQLIKDKVSVLGPNTGKVKLSPLTASPRRPPSRAPARPASRTPRGCTCPSRAAAGEADRRGQDVRDRVQEGPNVSTMEPYTAYAAQAAEMMLRDRGVRRQPPGDHRPAVQDKVTERHPGLVHHQHERRHQLEPGHLRRHQGGKLKTYKVITPPTSLVAAS